MLRQIMQWIGSGISPDSGISLLTLIVLAWTLWWVYRYARAAEKQVAASLEQVEALQRPLLTIEYNPRDLLAAFPGTFQQMFSGTDPLTQGVIPVLGIVPQGGLKIRNIGSGPALNVAYELQGTVLRGSIPYLPNEGFQTQIRRISLQDQADSSDFCIVYESLRAVKYETKITICRERTDDGNEYAVTTIVTKKLN